MPSQGRTRRIVVVLFLVVLAAAGAAAWSGVLKNTRGKRVVAGDPRAAGLDEVEQPTSSRAVLVVQPRRDPNVQVDIEQLATVESFYRADLRARASGVVKAVHKNIGERVKQGELLVEIDVPDLGKEVAQKECVVEQKRQELRAAQAHVKSAEAMLGVGRASVEQRKSEVTQAEATRDLRYKRLARYKQLASRDALGPDVVDEQERDYLSAKAGVEGAKVAVKKAQAELTEKEASVEAAVVDTDLKASQIEVAIKDLERVRALADYARIYAPFDGEITDRNVDPGSFVQNATTGQSEILIRVERLDKVTVVARVADNAAPFISPDTEISFEVNELPGVTIKAKVTRRSPTIQNKDRTMKVEVDLPQDAASPDKTKGGPRLLPGMSGVMHLRLGRFASGFVLPATAVYVRGGKPYILEVRDGVTKRTPVRVLLNDGKVVKVAVLRQVHGREIVQELTGTEQVVASRQQEIGEGQPVSASLADW